MEQVKFKKITSDEIFNAILKAIGQMSIDDLLVAGSAISKMEVSVDVREVLEIAFSAMLNYKIYERQCRQMSNVELIKKSENVELPEFAQSIIARILIERVPVIEEFELLVEQVLN